MERRSHERLPSKVKARMFYGNIFYTGKVTDLSEKGVFVSTKMNFPLNTVFILVVLVNNHTLKILSRVKRALRAEYDRDGAKSGMGIELLSPPLEYMEFIRDQKLINNSVN